MIVMGNTASTDPLNTAEHVAAFVLPGKQARSAATGPPTISDLLGTYRRKALPADKTAVDTAMRTAIFAGKLWPYHGVILGGYLTLRISRDQFGSVTPSCTRRQTRAAFRSSDILLASKLLTSAPDSKPI